MGRFYKNLKQKTLAGSGGPTSAQLQVTGQTIYIEKSNSKDLDEVIQVQHAHQLQCLNAGLPHPGLSSIVDVTIPDSGAPTEIKTPVNQEILEVGLLSIKNTSGGSAAVSIAITDGTTSVPIVAGLSVANGATTVLLNPLGDAGSTSSLNTPFKIDSGLYIMGSSDAEVSIQMGYRILSTA